MGSIGTPKQWIPYDSFKDCSQGVCSIYCPQWCYIIFPPPPHFEPAAADNDAGTTPFSPLIISVISVLASGFLLVSFYILLSRYCRRRDEIRNPNSEIGMNFGQVTQDQWQVSSSGLDEVLIKSITVCKFKKSEGLVQGNDCAVCLSEFQEGESLRLLPKCSHAFHLPCIDTWLKSHSNCPLCRANILSATPLPSPAPNLENHSSTLNISSLEFHRLNDLIFIIDDRNSHHCEEVVVNLVHDATPKNNFYSNCALQSPELRNSRIENEPQLRRSVSLDSAPFQRQILIAEIQKIDGNKEEKKDRVLETGIGSSKGEIGTGEHMERSVSTGRFKFP